MHLSIVDKILHGASSDKSVDENWILLAHAVCSHGRLCLMIPARAHENTHRPRHFKSVSNMQHVLCAFVGFSVSLSCATGGQEQRAMRAANSKSTRLRRWSRDSFICVTFLCV